MKGSNSFLMSHFQFEKNCGVFAWARKHFKFILKIPNGENFTTRAYQRSYRNHKILIAPGHYKRAS